MGEREDLLFIVLYDGSYFNKKNVSELLEFNNPHIII